MPKAWNLAIIVCIIGADPSKGTRMHNAYVSAEAGRAR